MKVLIFLLARCRRLFCSSRQRSRTLRTRGGKVSPGGAGQSQGLTIVHAGGGRESGNLATEPERCALNWAVST